MAHWGHGRSPTRTLSVFAVTAILLSAPRGCDTVVVTGSVTVKGSEPHTYLALVTDEGDFSLRGDMRQVLSSYQHSTVTLRARIVRDARGPGLPAELEVIEILKVAGQ